MKTTRDYYEYFFRVFRSTRDFDNNHCRAIIAAEATGKWRQPHSPSVCLP